MRNEKENINTLLHALASQDYSPEDYEVIFVNDHSTDDTTQQITSHKNNLKLRILELGEFATGKKMAIAAGVEAASGELIICTDADCSMPASWLSTYAAFYSSTHAKFIAAPVLMEDGMSVLRLLQSLDFLAMQGITGAAVSRHFHTLCNGANLAYQREVFKEVNGFEGIDNIPSGDDMLLMYKIFEKYPEEVRYLKSKNAIVSTHPEGTWKKFFNQRIRWSSKAVHYKDKRVFYILLLTYLINLGFVVLFVASFTWVNWFMFLLLFLAAKTLIEFPFVNATAIFFERKKWMIWFPFLQPLHIIYVISCGWLGRFGGYQWKSRTINPDGSHLKD